MNGGYELDALCEVFDYHELDRKWIKWAGRASVDDLEVWMLYNRAFESDWKVSVVNRAIERRKIIR